MGHTQYHLMIIISVLLVIQQIYAVDVKKKSTVINFMIRINPYVHAS